MLSVVIVKMTIRASLGRVKPSLFSLTDCYFKFYQLRSYSKDNPSNINHGPFFVHTRCRLLRTNNSELFREIIPIKSFS